MKVNKSLLVEVKVGWYPGIWVDKVEWYNNFAGKIGIYTATLELDPLVVAARVNDCNMARYLVDWVIQREASQQRCVEYRNIMIDGKDGESVGPLSAFAPLPAPTAVAAGINARIFGFIDTINALPAMSDDIRKDLKIFDKTETIDLNQYPTDLLSVTATPNGIKFSFRKRVLDGITVFVSMDGGVTFREASKVTLNGWLDTTKNVTNVPESRIYKAKGLYKDQVVGLFSKEFGVVAEVYNN